MTSESMRERFEARFPALDHRKHVYDETWWGSENTMPTYRSNWTEGIWIGWKAAWQAATLAERERAAKVCESLRDLKEEARSLLKAAEALQLGDKQDIINRLSHEQTVRLYNGAMDKCAEAIRKGES